DKDTAAAGLEALVAAIAELTEETQDVAVRPLPASGDARLASIATLRRIGEDMSALASAMEVLQRRCS
ncbi:MAG: hypothetical protein Q8R82_11925, partial [Hyphomonadaceae bacterium]|nr:hypothetical protein [Hyphomonadaceae bacterium]